MRSPTNSSGSFRSKTLSSASGNARSTSGSASSAPSRQDLRGTRRRAGAASRPSRAPRRPPTGSRRARAARPPAAPSRPSSRGSGARSLTRSSPVIRPTFSAPEPLAEPAVRLLREHPQRPGVDAAPRLGELLERGVGLPGVRRPEVRDDALGLALARRQRDLDPALGLRGHACAGAPLGALRAARPLLAAARRSALRIGATVAADAEPGMPGPTRSLRPGGSGGASAPSRARRCRARRRAGSAAVLRERRAPARRGPRCMFWRIGGTAISRAEEQQHDRRERAHEPRQQRPRA